MDLDELSKDELDELESRLYAQVHHDVQGGGGEASITTRSTPIIKLDEEEFICAYNEDKVTTTTPMTVINVENFKYDEQKDSELSNEVTSSTQNVQEIKTREVRVLVQRLSVDEIRSIKKVIADRGLTRRPQTAKRSQQLTSTKKKDKIVTICLDSSSSSDEDESDKHFSEKEDDDVIILPTQPLTVITLDDSEDEQLEDAGAVDASPTVCNEDSIDDFISEKDRQLLKQPNVSAFDELLTGIGDTDKDSSTLTGAGLSYPSASKKTPAIVSDDSDVEYCNLNTPAADKGLDEGVYSKGKKRAKKTIVRNLETSSEDEQAPEKEDQGIANEPNEVEKGSAANEISAQGVPRHMKTPLAGVLRGRAIESLKLKIVNCDNSKGKDNSTSTSKVANPAIALVSEESNDEDEDADCIVKPPTAREIAQEALRRKRAAVLASNAEEADNDAIPASACAGLEDVFKKIEELGRNADERRRNRRIEHPAFHNQTFEEDRSEESIVEMPNSVIYWNTEMKCFYNMTWKGENFSLHHTLLDICPNQSLWCICSPDRCELRKSHNYFKCHNCNERGHTTSNCRSPKKIMICDGCGNTGHREPNCPNAICIGCCNPAKKYVSSCNKCMFQNRLICPLCRMQGHAATSCPDLWRRHHSSTDFKMPLVSDVSYKQKMHCSVCGSRNHYAEDCGIAANFLKYPLACTKIVDYKHVYDDQPFFGTTITSVCNYDPNDMIDDRIRFKHSQPPIEGGFLLRFMNSVGLQYNHKTPEVEKDHNASNTVKVEPMSSSPQVQGNKSTICVTQVKQEELENRHQEEAKEDEENVPKEREVELPSAVVNQQDLVLCQETEPKVVKPNIQKASPDFKNLPDIIKFSKSGDDETIDPDRDWIEPTGISNCFRDTGNYDIKPLPEEKLYLDSSDANYILSTQKCSFLSRLTSACNVTAEMSRTKETHILTYRGLPENLALFYDMIVKKLREYNKERSSKWVTNTTPKNVETAILHLENALNRLNHDLGDVNKIYLEYKTTNAHYTLSSQIMANTLRRKLNMILLGQAKLGLGRNALDILNKSLETLRTGYARTDRVSNQLRETIRKTQAMIFEPHDNVNYEEMVKTYNVLMAKGEIRFWNNAPAAPIVGNGGGGGIGDGDSEIAENLQTQQQQTMAAPMTQELPQRPERLSAGKRLAGNDFATYEANPNKRSFSGADQASTSSWISPDMISQQFQQSMQQQQRRDPDDQHSAFWSKAALDRLAGIRVQQLTPEAAQHALEVERKAKLGKVSKNEYNFLVASLSLAMGI